jgi:DNA polymerase-3 subunit gamma/tau
MSQVVRKSSPQATDGRTPAQPYQVVARRFRPQLFEQLIGQEQVAAALSAAITQNRVGHAYLFTGARGVGKTSAARIFAKCLNCQTGVTLTPCGTCDICRGVASGDDIDVMEIDGASNRGIEEIRQLRANAIIRPTRARYKIYIIDEVHMLTKEAFNALLKTLEEPPSHVKFIFCTTDPEKIPITVLSRCQRYDFPPISTRQIQERLAEIAAAENVAADEAALALLARRANGSMRDSQSLFEQLLGLSATRITEADVHRLLGTADSGRILALAQTMVERRTQNALGMLAEMLAEGVDAGQLTEQMMGVFRDALVLAIDGTTEQLLHTAAHDQPALQAICAATGVEQLMAMMEVLDQTLVRMRHSSHVRTLLELATVRITRLENLDELAALVQQLRADPAAVPAKPAGSPAVARPATPQAPSRPVAAATGDDAERSQTSPKKKGERAEPGPDSAAEAGVTNELATEAPGPVGRPIPLDTGSLDEVWRAVLAEVGSLTAEMARHYRSLRLEDDRLEVVMSDTYHCTACQRPDRKSRIEEALQRLTGRTVRVDFREGEEADRASAPDRPAPLSMRQQVQRATQNPFVRKAIECLGAEIVELRANGEAGDD